MRRNIKKRLSFVFGIIMTLTFISCQPRDTMSSNTTLILSKSIEKIIGTDSLRFFPPLFLSDGASDSENNQTRKKYEKQKIDYLKVQKYIGLPDSVTVECCKTRKIERIDTAQLSLKRFYRFTSDSKTTTEFRNPTILASITRITIKINDSKNSAKVIYKIRSSHAEFGGWTGELTLAKIDNNWTVKENKCIGNN